MKVLPEISNMSCSRFKTLNDSYTLINFNNDTNVALSYKESENSNFDILSDLIECKAYATALLYLNENYILDNKFGYLLENQNIMDFYDDCEDLLKKNIKVVEVAGIPLTDIKGYKIYESDIGIVRGNNSKKIFESFDKINIEDITLDLLKDFKYDMFIEAYAVCPECKAVFYVPDNTEQTTTQDVEMYSTLDNPAAEKVVDYDVTMATCPYCGHSDELGTYYVASLEDLLDAPNKEELVPGISELTEDTLTEDGEGTQATDIAPKVDQEVGALTKAKPEKKYYDILLSDIDENADEILNKGFIKNKDGHYQRGNYVLVKENDKYIAIRKDKLK